MKDQPKKYRKQGNPANLRPAHDSAEVIERLAKEERHKLAVLFDFVEKYRARELVETESFVELLKRQEAQSKRVDALHREYGRAVALLSQVQEQLLTLEVDMARDRKRNRLAIETLKEVARRINDVLNVRLAAGLPAFDSPKKARG